MIKAIKKAWAFLVAPHGGIVPADITKPAPCGNDQVHYFWSDRPDMPCPLCYQRLKQQLVAQEKAEKKRQERVNEDRLADKIASRLAVRMARAERQIRRLRRIK